MKNLDLTGYSVSLPSIMRCQNHIRGQEILDVMLEGKVAVLKGASKKICSATAPVPFSSQITEREEIIEFNTCYSC